MYQEELQTKLDTLRSKWKGKVPKSDLDPNYWAFKCDECIAIGIKRKLKINEPVSIKPDLETMVKEIFS